MSGGCAPVYTLMDDVEQLIAELALDPEREPVASELGGELSSLPPVDPSERVVQCSAPYTSQHQ